MSVSKPAWRAIALIVAAVFFAVALRVDIDNATAPHSLAQILFHQPDRFGHPHWLSLHFWLRKTYSVVAFTIVGFCAHRALPPATRPIFRAASIVAGYSLAIEIAQHVWVSVEPLLESAFDIACGAFGGWLAIVGSRNLRRTRHAAAQHVDERAGTK